ncbi:hypothetical protein KJ742_02500 [Patescibacteria group bacterium]|nr:hypothetical protein [Patescibacteria group bacterium]MBU1682791.1 hypothetical protein [Patescibacteria group bacterium]MBU1935394.1 hypothetical protein [Patescibacteria group bacterium]
MIKLIRKIAIVFAFFLIFYLGYEAFFHDSAAHWRNFKEPQLAAYTSLEQDEAILMELDRQTRFNSYKPLDPVYFIKPSIFQTIERK